MTQFVRFNQLATQTLESGAHKTLPAGETSRQSYFQHNTWVCWMGRSRACREPLLYIHSTWNKWGREGKESQKSKGKRQKAKVRKAREFRTTIPCGLPCPAKTTN